MGIESIMLLPKFAGWEGRFTNNNWDQENVHEIKS